jgi:hypothetical protein
MGLDIKTYSLTVSHNVTLTLTVTVVFPEFPVHVLFIDTVRKSDSITSRGKMAGELCIGWNMQGTCCDVV